LRDTALPPKWQDKAAANIGAEVVTVDSGHMAPLTHPKELAAILNRIAGEGWWQIRASDGTPPGDMPS
jgi:pimeloyl-ACP methyl ester carboxylesterase